MQYSLAAKNSNTYASVIQAMVKYGREQGVDSANPEKIADNFKDISEKLGDFKITLLGMRKSKNGLVVVP